MIKVNQAQQTYDECLLYDGSYFCVQALGVAKIEDLSKLILGKPSKFLSPDLF